MKKNITIAVLIFMNLSCIGQDWDQVLKQELYNNLENPSDSLFIIDRITLEQLKEYKCEDSIVLLEYNNSTGDHIVIKIEVGNFIPSKHILNLEDIVFKYIHGKKIIDYFIAKDSIDNKYAYGVDGLIPKNEIKEITIKWNGKDLFIPKNAYSDLFEPHICENNAREIEFYKTKDNFLFIYLSGSDGAGSYSVKFIFNKKKYVTRIIGTNEMTDGFDFIDGTATVED
jgi:hypothetical protein